MKKTGKVGVWVAVVCADGLLYYSVVFVAYYTVRVNGLNVGSAGARCRAARSSGSFSAGADACREEGGMDLTKVLSDGRR